MSYVTLSEIQAAAARIAGTAVRTPLVRLGESERVDQVRVGTADWKLQAERGVQHDLRN